MKNRRFTGIVPFMLGLFIFSLTGCLNQGKPDSTKAVNVVKTSWESVAENYSVPEWFKDGKFGIFLHWGLYAVPGKQSEWYSRHMYSDKGIAAWHRGPRL